MSDKMIETTENVEIRDPTDSFVLDSDSHENVLVKDTEFLYTGVDSGISFPSDREKSTVDYQCREDAYVKSAGDTIIISGANTVYVEPQDVALETENVKTVHKEDMRQPKQSYRPILGWNQVEKAGESKLVNANAYSSKYESVLITGSLSQVTLTEISGNLDVYLTGYRNTVTIYGTGDVNIYTVGCQNTVVTGEKIDARTESDAGTENRIF